jgi:hypothetical protein
MASLLIYKRNISEGNVMDSLDESKGFNCQKVHLATTFYFVKFVTHRNLRLKLFTLKFHQKKVTFPSTKNI